MDNKFNMILSEYNSLKSEQLERIKIRDTLIYISLGIFGAIFSYVMTGDHTNDKAIVLLILPTISFILAWMYIVNDEKVSQIGKYIRYNLSEKLKKITNQDDLISFGWEQYHRNDNKRSWRKTLQIASDLMTFVVPSIVSIGTYFFILKPDASQLLKFLTYLDVAIVGFTAWLIIYFDHSERKKDSQID